MSVGAIVVVELESRLRRRKSRRWVGGGREGGDREGSGEGEEIVTATASASGGANVKDEEGLPSSTPNPSLEHMLLVDDVANQNFPTSLDGSGSSGVTAAGMSFYGGNEAQAQREREEEEAEREEGEEGREQTVEEGEGHGEGGCHSASNSPSVLFARYAGSDRRHPPPNLIFCCRT